jgi:excisionase family DNA binding protein
MLPIEQAFKPHQVAQILQIHIDRYYELANRGEIPAFRLGREWRTAPSQLEKFMIGEWKAKPPKRRPGRQIKDYSYLAELVKNGSSIQ